MKRILCLLLLLGLPGLPAPAHADDLYTLRGVGVDVSDVSALEAKRKAEREALLLAFHRLVRKLTLQQDWQRLPRLSLEEIESLQLSSQIESEEVGSTRYRANVTISFDGEAVQALLSDADIGFLEFSPLTTLILPLYNDREEWVLWPSSSMPNPWWQAWDGLNSNLLATSYLLPLADLEDRLTLPTLRLAAGEDELLAQIAARYDLDRILLARAFPVPEVQERAVQVRVSLYRILAAAGGVERLGSFTFRARDMDAAVAHIAARMEQDWKSRNIRKYDAPSIFRLRARFADIEEWARMLQDLRAASYIRSLKVEEVGIGGAWLKIGFNGGGRMLVEELHRNGFLVSRQGEEWVLQRSSAP